MKHDAFQTLVVLDNESKKTPCIGLRMAILGMKQLLVRWQGCKVMSNIMK